MRVPAEEPAVELAAGQGLARIQWNGRRVVHEPQDSRGSVSVDRTESRDA